MDVIPSSIRALYCLGSAVLRDLGIADDDRHCRQPVGRAIALAIPGRIGRPLTTHTAVNQLHAFGGRYARANHVCIGVGQGIAVVLERIWIPDWWQGPDQSGLPPPPASYTKTTDRWMRSSLTTPRQKPAFRATGRQCLPFFRRPQCPISLSLSPPAAACSRPRSSNRPVRSGHCSSAMAQAPYPSKSFHHCMIVPFSAGGTTDIPGARGGPDPETPRLWARASFHRQPAPARRQYRRPGRGPRIAGDGLLTLFMGTVGVPHAIQRSPAADALRPGPGLPLPLLARVASVAQSAGGSTPARPASRRSKEMMAYAAAHNPGKLFEFRLLGLGDGSIPPVHGELFRVRGPSGHGSLCLQGQRAGTSPISHIGQPDRHFMFDNMPSAIQHVRSGKLRSIAR